LTLVPQGALQWENTWPAFSIAVNVTFAPFFVCSVHRGRQLIPVGAEVTAPFPLTATVSVGFGAAPDAAPTSPSAAATIPIRTSVFIPCKPLVN
jgi:hypothetical protein